MENFEGDRTAAASAAPLKTCTKCGEVKAMTEFWADRRRTDGKQRACITCQKVAALEFRQRNPEYFKRKGKDRYWQIGRDENKERYSKRREDFLRRRGERGLTARGRLMDLTNAARLRAAKSGRAFAIDHEAIFDLWERQQARCAVTGMEMTLEPNERGERLQRPFGPSIDRIDASKGYEPGNVRLVCVIVNLALNKFGDDAFARMCRAFVLTNNNKEN